MLLGVLPGLGAIVASKQSVENKVEKKATAVRKEYESKNVTTKSQNSEQLELLEKQIAALEAKLAEKDDQQEEQDKHARLRQLEMKEFRQQRQRNPFMNAGGFARRAPMAIPGHFGFNSLSA